MTSRWMSPAAGSVGRGQILAQSGLPIALPGSGFFANNGVYVMGQAPAGGATASFSATSGAGVTMTMSAASLLGTAADVGRVLTILDTTYKLATITAQSSTTVATVTLTGTLSGTGPFANSSIWLTAGLPFPTTYANGYFSFPANVISASTPAGVYFGQFAGPTQGTIFNNPYTVGSPAIPASPTAFATTGTGAFAQTGSEVTLVSATIPANGMGVNGELQIDGQISFPNTANNKTLGTFFGASHGIFTNIPNASGAQFMTRVRNRGATGAQFCTSGSQGDIGTPGSAKYLAIDTTAAVTAAISGTLATATEFYVIEAFSMKLFPN